MTTSKKTIAIYVITVLVLLPVNFTVAEAEDAEDIEHLLELVNGQIKHHFNISRDYYALDNVDGDPVNWSLWEKYNLIAYGSSSDFNSNGVPRYLGYSINGDKVSNIRYPIDTPISKLILEAFAWIRRPWAIKYKNLESFMTTNANYANDGINANPRLNKNIIAGLEKYHHVDDGWMEPILNKKGSENYKSIPWHKFVHVVQPPTQFSEGQGIMFRLEDGDVRYKTVPIAAFKDVNPDFWVDITDLVYDFQGYKGILKVGLIDDGRVLPLEASIGLVIQSSNGLEREIVNKHIRSFSSGDEFKIPFEVRGNEIGDLLIAEVSYSGDDANEGSNTKQLRLNSGK